MQVLVGGENEFNGLVYGDKHPATLEFLKNQVSQTFSNTLTEVGRQIYSSLGSLFDKFNGESATNLIRSARQKVSGIFHQDVVRSLFEVEEIQQAALTMQRWIMAMPNLRALYQAQRCDGFSETYKDAYPDAIGESHYDYRRVMDGVATEDEEGTLKLTYYYDIDYPEDKVLSLPEKVDILNTWDAIQYYLNKGQTDPSSAIAGML